MNLIWMTCERNKGFCWSKLASQKWHWFKNWRKKQVSSYFSNENCQIVGKWLVWHDFTWLHKFFSTIQDTFQVYREKYRKISIFKISCLKYHLRRPKEFWPFFWISLLDHQNQLLSMILLLQKHVFYKLQQFLFPKSEK